jgi:hypothetical protein
MESMSKQERRSGFLLPVAAGAMALTLLLAGCGGGGGEATTGSEGAQPITPQTAVQRQASDNHPTNARGDRDAGEGDFGPAHSPSSPSSSPEHHDSQTGAVPFKTKGGDNSIQESGSEASSSELDQAAAALHGFLNARAAGDWAAACSFTAATLTDSLGELAGGGGGSLRCPRLLAVLSAGVPSAALREAAIADVGGLRVEGDSAFLLFHGAYGESFFIPMVREGGDWKVAAIAASPLQ